MFLMNIILILSLILINLLNVSCRSYYEDEIQFLPGFFQAFPSRQFSGYLENNNGQGHLHYWFVESENDPINDPVVLWLNGGPGCSSLDGFFLENGPFEISSDGNYLTLREDRWNRMANMLYIESPVGVGFSYADNDSLYHHNDETTAQGNYEAVEAFFELFPQYKSNRFYITGESYAGIYIPTLANLILQATEKLEYTGASLRGIAVGNGCTGTDIGICGYYNNQVPRCQGLYYEMQFLMGLNFFSEQTTTKMNQVCDWNACKDINANISVLSNECGYLINNSSYLLSNINIYNVYGECAKDHCEGSNVLSGQTKASSNYPQFLTGEFTGYGNQRKLFSNDDYVALQPGPFGCSNSGGAIKYLNRDDVQYAIHVIKPAFCWDVCHHHPSWSYNSTVSNLPRDTYPYLISKIDVLIYNGDWDACVPVTDNEAWTENMGYPVLKPWKQWMYESPLFGKSNLQIGGYRVIYDVSTIGNGSFEFKTVRTAGHMVPEDSSLASLAMFSHFIGIDIPPNSEPSNGIDVTIKEYVYKYSLSVVIGVTFLGSFIFGCILSLCIVCVTRNKSSRASVAYRLVGEDKSTLHSPREEVITFNDNENGSEL